MAENFSPTFALPVLPVDDAVVLPGMVVPVALAGADGADARAGVEAAQAATTDDGKPQVVLVPRLDGRYAKAGTVGVIEQIGRLPGGQRAAVIRATDRVRIGSGTTGPGAALWVDVEITEE